MVNAGRDNDTVNIQGSDVGSIRLGRGDDELNFIDTTVSTDIRGGTGTDSLNLPVGTIVNDATFGTFTVTVGGSYSLSNGTFTLPSGNTVTYTTFENGTGFPCFVRGTQIQTTQGLRRVETLKVGDLIPTSTNNSQKNTLDRQPQIVARRVPYKSKTSPRPDHGGRFGQWAS